MKKQFLIALGLFLLTACAHPPKSEYDRNPSSTIALRYDERRGSPADYDPGAPADSKWVELFGSTPNYRSIGIEILKGKAMKDEKFRWVFGPMWYRGRLTPESVKVFVVGQEGAQDENISNRSFTGSTGTRVQKFLNHLGIYRSYLFLNTFVYTINGQLDDAPEFKWIEQGPGSPIVEYRNKLFDYMLETNSQTVALFMGVGRGGKASLATWINARGGKCSTSYELKNCDTSGMTQWFAENRGIVVRNKILAIGVPHPGGANPNLGGDAALQNIKRGFTTAAQRVAAFKDENPSWLKFDMDEKLDDAGVMARLKTDYEYKGYAPIPFRDFAFNTNWRMGSVGTTSNRWGADSIQVFSDAGVYNDKSTKFMKTPDVESNLNSTKTKLTDMADVDLAYESPRFIAEDPAHAKKYDFGPCGFRRQNDKPCELSEALTSWPDLKAMGIPSISHPSLGYFGTYRGRAKNAKVFVIADQTSHDDFFSTRALTGAEGQKLQTLFKNTGVGLDYFIMRTLPVDTLGAETATLIKGVLQPEMIATYKRIYDAVVKQGDIKVVIAFGPVARIIANQLEFPDSVQVVTLNSSYSNTSWNVNARVVANHLGNEYKKPFDGSLTVIPREDLPYHTRWWMGSTGDRAARGEGKAAGNYYRVWAPRWVNYLRPVPMKTEELQQLKNTYTNSIQNFMQITNAQPVEKDAPEAAVDVIEPVAPAVMTEPVLDETEQH